MFTTSLILSIKGGPKFSFSFAVALQLSASIFFPKLAASQLGLRDQQLGEYGRLPSWHSCAQQETRFPRCELQCAHAHVSGLLEAHFAVSGSTIGFAGFCSWFGLGSIPCRPAKVSFYVGHPRDTLTFLYSHFKFHAHTVTVSLLQISWSHSLAM